jgi:hypothetical protein
VKVGEVDDDTFAVMMRGFHLPEDVKYLKTSVERVPIGRKFRVVGSASAGHTPVVTSEIAAQMHNYLLQHQPRRFHARFHYRIVFNEIGKPMHDLRDLSQVYLMQQ